MRALHATRTLSTGFLSSGWSLECHACHSTTTMENCNAKKMECPPNNDQCIKIHLKVGVQESFLKGCSPKTACQSAENSICKTFAESDVTCDISCCDKDNCNAGSAFRVSGCLFVACALVSLLKLVNLAENNF